MARQAMYQYETSPRKLEPKYSNKPKRAKKVKSKTKVKLYNTKPLLYIAIGFAMLFVISYRNSVINENYAKKESLKNQLSQVEKENEQLKVNIESSLNLNNVEKRAREELGMQKLSNEQKIYVDLQKQDYIETSAEDVKIKENSNFWEKIMNSLTKIIK